MDTERELERLHRLAHWLDSRFRIPGTGIRFGVDSIIGLVPGLGDAAGALPSVYLVLKARQLGAPDSLLLQMGANVAIELVVGAIPIVGDLFDIGFKANRRNVDLLRRHLVQAGEVAGPQRTGQKPRQFRQS